MATTRFIDHLLEGDHASRPSAGSVPQGTLYACTTHTLIYQSDGTSTWSTWFTGGGGFTDPMTTRGDIIIRNASNVTARLGIGSAGKVLSSDGTDISWQTPSSGSGSTVWLQRQTANNTSQFMDFTSFISSTYSIYWFQMTDIVMASDNINWQVRVGTGGGPTIDTGNNYAQASFRTAPAGTATAGANPSSPASSWGLDGAGGVDNSANSSVFGDFWLYNPSGTAGHRSIKAHIGYIDNSGTSLQVITTGKYTTTTAITAVRFQASTGNVVSGTVDLYGLTHA